MYCNLKEASVEAKKIGIRGVPWVGLKIYLTYLQPNGVGLLFGADKSLLSTIKPVLRLIWCG
jgi:hypothetical protein